MTAVLNDKGAPDVPDDASAAAMLRRCFAFAPADRPTAAELAAALEEDGRTSAEAAQRDEVRAAEARAVAGERQRNTPALSRLLLREPAARLPEAALPLLPAAIEPSQPSQPQAGEKLTAEPGAGGAMAEELWPEHQPEEPGPQEEEPEDIPLQQSWWNDRSATFAVGFSAVGFLATML